MRELLVFAVLICVLNPVVIADELLINGFVRNYDSVSFDGEDELFRRNWLRLNFEYKPDVAKLYASLDFTNDNLTNTNVLEQRLREAYIDFSLGPVDLKVGKQQIVWGKADGTFITDIVNPFDLRKNFLVFDFPDVRIGLNSLKATYYYQDTGLEAVWIPTFVPHQFAPLGSPWAFVPPKSPIPLKMLNLPQFPETSLKNSEAGARLLTRFKGFDITFNYLYAWDDIPAYHKTIEVFTDKKKVDAATGPGVVITPQFKRLHVPGYTIVNAFGSLVVRSEGAIFLERYFDTRDEKAEGLLIEKPYINYMVGADYRISENWLLLGQFIQAIILDHNEQILRDGVETSATLRLSADFLDDEIESSIFVFYNFHDKDIWIWPEVSYEIIDSLRGAIGLHLFEGNKFGGRQGDKPELFGQFDENDYVYFKVQYSF